jgi:hypothetical protein
VGGLGHFLEDEGLATTQISLIREHTQIMRPPRALWVPFELGRPLGPPNDPAFQRRVLLAALELFAAPSGPVLEDFPDDAPAPAAVDGEEDGLDGWVCPVSFPRPDEGADTGGFRDAVLDEIGLLAPWYDLASRNRGRTTFGVSGLDIEAVARFINAVLGREAVASPMPEMPLGQAVNMACEDLKAFYMEAATAKPGRAGSKEIADWFWGGTAAGRMILTLRATGRGHPEPSIAEVISYGLLVPRAQLYRLKEFEEKAGQGDGSK